VDFSFGEEQEMLRDSARRFLTEAFPTERIGDGDGGDARWREVAGLGWTSLSIPEEDGGAGMSFLEEAILFEETGRALYPGPYLSTVGLALPALRGGSLARVVAGEVAAALASTDASAGVTTAEETGSGWTLSGRKTLVPHLPAADLVVVVAKTPQGPALFEATGGEHSTLPTLDVTRPVGTVAFERTPADLLVPPAEAEEVLRRIRRRALAALALEAVGVAEAVLDMTRAYASERHQFGKPIGVYQAVSHSIADMYRDVELARSLAYFAAWCVAEDDDRAEVAVPAAKAFAGEAAVDACERAIQVHGGIGFTWEHALHRYLKRAQWIEAFDAHPPELRREVAAYLLDDRSA
jgi:alkylation response protein AidB-like acyl-CoA dehydrogenase